MCFQLISRNETPSNRLVLCVQVFLLLVELGHVEALVDDLGDGLNLGAELLLDAVEDEAVVIRDEADGDTEVTEAARATDAMQVRLGHLREVEVDDHVHRLDVDSASEQI